MSSSDVAIKSMDLARSITDILGKGGAVSGLVGETMKWLARERIDEADFTYCLNKTRALLYPNSKGLEIQSSLREADEKLRRNPFVAGLSLLGAGSIGRWMAQSPEYCYLATTVATLLIHHDMNYAAKAICDMILFEEKQVDEDTGVRVYALCKSKLLPILKKVVESITLNVVNCGHDLGAMPPQLRDICGHGCTASAFAEVTMVITRSSGNLIIRCTKFPADIFVWALAHLEGDIELSIAGQIVYQEKIGLSRRALLFIVDKDCSCKEQQRSVLGEDTAGTITVSASMEGGLCILSETNLEIFSISGKRASTRAALYSLDGYTGCSFEKLLPEEKRHILQASQNVILWVLRRPASLCSIGHSDQSIVSKSSDLLIGDLVSRWPRICNERFGGAWTVATVSPSMCKSQLYLDEVLSRFQETREVLDICSSRCSCLSCFHHVTGRSTRPGCLKAMAESEILRLIAHAIADGFGADDTSGLGSAKSIEEDTSHLLLALLSESIIPWQAWFGLAASVYLGCGTLGDIRERIIPCGLVAIQYGSSVVAAPWIDLSREVQTTALFGFETAQARLCGVDADYAYICTENTARSSFGDLDLSEAKLPQHEHGEADGAEMSLLATIQSPATKIPRCPFELFTLVTIARVGKYTRIIDPIAIFDAIASSVAPRCTHTISTTPAASLSSPHRIWSFEEAVGFWEAKNFEDTSSSWTYYTTIIDSHAKLNTLLTLSPQGCVVKMADCCFACAQTQLDSRCTDSEGRRILSIAMDEKSLSRR